MDPISYTAFTLLCMGGAYFWGKRDGMIRGSHDTWGIIIEAFDAEQLHWNQETNELIFVDSNGVSRKASEAWKNGNS